MEKEERERCHTKCVFHQRMKYTFNNDNIKLCIVHLRVTTIIGKMSQ